MVPRLCRREPALERLMLQRPAPPATQRAQSFTILTAQTALPLRRLVGVFSCCMPPGMPLKALSDTMPAVKDALFHVTNEPQCHAGNMSISTT